MTVHFAYGSNMSRSLMEKRCAAVEALGTARLAGWQFFITRDGYASIRKVPGAAVFGVLWRLNARDLAALNAYENLQSGLYTARVLPLQHGKRMVKALMYVARSTAAGCPRAGYQEQIVIPAARAWNLPEDYVAELSRWSAGIRRNPSVSMRERGNDKRP